MLASGNVLLSNISFYTSRECKLLGTFGCNLFLFCICFFWIEKSQILKNIEVFEDNTTEIIFS